MHTVHLTDDEYAVLCGVLAPSADTDPIGGVNHDGIFTECWDELRAKFPVYRFTRRIDHHKRRLGTEYDEGAGNPLTYDPNAGV